MPLQRLQKILSAANIGSRRKCEEMILEGVITVNGKVIYSLPAFADPDNDVIAVNGRKIYQAKKVYYLLNKPKGVICTSHDPQGRIKAVDMVPSTERVFCVGRLEADTTGLIILTNDNDLTNRLTHPRYDVPKVYIAVINGKIDTDAVDKLRKGVWLSDGKTSASGFKILSRGHNESIIQISIKQAVNRQIHRMFARVGFKVKSIKRIKIGKIDIGGLGVGKARTLTSQEISYLKKITSGEKKNDLNKHKAID